MCLNLYIQEFSVFSFHYIFIQKYCTLIGTLAIITRRNATRGFTIEKFTFGDVSDDFFSNPKMLGCKPDVQCVLELYKKDLLGEPKA